MPGYLSGSGYGQIPIRRDEDLRDPNIGQPEDSIYAGENPELYALMRQKPPAPTGRAQAFLNRGGSDPALATERRQIVNPNAGIARIDDSEAMLPEQVSRAKELALAQWRANPRPDLTATFNGVSYSMPQSGPRVSGEKAKSFLALAQQEADRKRAEAEQTRQAGIADRRLKMEEQRGAVDLEGATLKNEAARQGMTMAQRASEAAQRDADYNRNKRLAEDARAEQGRLTPEQERLKATYEQIVASPTAAPRAKQLAQERLLTMAGASTDIAMAAGRPNAQTTAAPVMDAINNDPLVAGRVQELKGAIARAQDLPWYKDLGSALTLGAYQGEQSPAEVEQIRGEVDAIAAQAAAQYGLDEASVRQAILNQILPGVTDQTPGVARQIRTGLRR